MDKKFTLTRGPHFLSLFLFFIASVAEEGRQGKRDASTKLLSLDAGKGHLQRLSLHFEADEIRIQDL